MELPSAYQKRSLFGGLSSGGLTNEDRLVTKDTILVVVKRNLVAETVCMVYVAIILLAVKSDDDLSFPDSLKANRTVEVLAFLKEKTAIRPEADFACKPCVLSWVCLTNTDAVGNEGHQD